MPPPPSCYSILRIKLLHMAIVVEVLIFHILLRLVKNNPAIIQMQLYIFIIRNVAALKVTQNKLKKFQFFFYFHPISTVHLFVHSLSWA